jgi:putative radical SAM-modified peptide
MEATVETKDNELVILEEGRDDTEEVYACCSGGSARQ